MKTIEKLSTNIFDKVFGTDLESRMEALKNEYIELQEAFEMQKNQPCPLHEENFLNELADVQSIITHITSICNDSFERQLLYTNEKLLSRIEISKYKGELLKTD